MPIKLVKEAQFFLPDFDNGTFEIFRTYSEWGISNKKHVVHFSTEKVSKKYRKLNSSILDISNKMPSREKSLLHKLYGTFKQ